MEKLWNQYSYVLLLIVLSFLCGISYVYLLP